MYFFTPDNRAKIVSKFGRSVQTVAGAVTGGAIAAFIVLAFGLARSLSGTPRSLPVYFPDTPTLLALGIGTPVGAVVFGYLFSRLPLSKSTISFAWTTVPVVGLSAIGIGNVPEDFIIWIPVLLIGAVIVWLLTLKWHFGLGGFAGLIVGVASLFIYSDLQQAMFYPHPLVLEDRWGAPVVTDITRSTATIQTNYLDCRDLLKPVPFMVLFGTSTNLGSQSDGLRLEDLQADTVYYFRLKAYGRAGVRGAYDPGHDYVSRVYTFRTQPLDSLGESTSESQGGANEDELACPPSVFAKQKGGGQIAVEKATIWSLTKE